MVRDVDMSMYVPGCFGMYLHLRIRLSASSTATDVADVVASWCVHVWEELQKRTVSCGGEHRHGATHLGLLLLSDAFGRQMHAHE